MKVNVQRLMDDGYGNVHIIAEGYFDETLYNDIVAAPSESDIYQILMDVTPDTDVDLNIIGNPNGYANSVDEFYIYVDGKLFKRI